MAGEDFTEITIDDAALDAIKGAHGVLAPTDDADDSEATYTRRAAALLAARLDTTLYLSDRTKRTWTETPHVRGPATVDTLRAQGVGYMVEQMEEALTLGAPDVRAVAPSMPNLDSLSDVLEATGASVIVIPEAFSHQRLLDRWQIHGDLPARVKERADASTVLIARADGRVGLA